MFLEFSDYQCPFCSRVQPTITLLRDQYKNDVVFGYRHSPLPFHREADEAAIAAVMKTRFKPGKQRGKPVRVQVSIPILFKLN